MATDAVVMEPAGEWVDAFEVQQRFLQHSGPGIDSLDYSGCCRQMGEVGGDFYNFVTLPGNRLAVVGRELCQHPDARASPANPDWGSQRVAGVVSHPGSSPGGRGVIVRAIQAPVCLTTQQCCDCSQIAKCIADTLKNPDIS